MSPYKAKRPFLLILFSTLALLIGVVLLAGSVQAQPGSSSEFAPLGATANAFAHLQPGPNAPANGGNVPVGTKFTLDLFINTGSNRSPDGVTAAQSYMTFNPSVMEVIPANGSCSSIPNNTTVTPDNTIFEAGLQ